MCTTKTITEVNYAMHLGSHSEKGIFNQLTDYVYRYVYIVSCIVTEKPHQESVNKLLYFIVY